MPFNISMVSLFVISIIVSFILFNFLIKVSHVKKIFDNPNEFRKFHKNPTPNIGGVAIFFTILFCILFYTKFFPHYDGINFLLASNILLFLFGLKDDLVGLSSSKRFYAQLIAGIILIYFGDFRINNLSVIGLSSITYSLSICSSLLFYVLITNTYNLIDGINGLLGSLTFLACICFTIIFYNSTDMFLLALLTSMTAAILGFLYFNLGNASIFMGSSGSYIIGSLMYFYSISLINIPNSISIVIPKFALLFSFLAIPLFDTIRVFVLRIIKGKSPFNGDANHIHHRLLKLNTSHTRTVVIMLMANIILILFNITLKNISGIKIILIDLIILIILNLILEYYIKKFKKF